MCQSPDLKEILSLTNSSVCLLHDKRFYRRIENKMRVRGKLAKLPTLCLYITVGDTGKDTKRLSCHIFSTLRLYFYFSKDLLN